MHPDFDNLYRENATKVARLAFQLTGDRTLAEDVVQETFLAVHRGFGAFRGEAAPSTWVYRIALRVSVRLRERARRSANEALAVATDVRERSDIAGSDPMPGRSRRRREEGRDDHEELLLALHALPEELRLVVSLMNLRDLPVAQVATILDIPEGTVWSRASTARKRMRAWLEARAASPVIPTP